MNKHLKEKIELLLAQDWNALVDNEEHWASTGLILKGVEWLRKLLEETHEARLATYFEDALPNDPVNCFPWPEIMILDPSKWHLLADVLLSSWGHVLWDIERLMLIKDCDFSFSNSSCRWKVTIDESSSPGPDIFDLRLGYAGQTPLDDDEAFEPSFEARKILQTHGHFGVFDMFAFGVHFDDGELPQQMDIVWCLGHYHNHPKSCFKCEEEEWEQTEKI